MNASNLPAATTADLLLRELHLQLAAAADALTAPEPDLDLARASVGRARAALTQLGPPQEGASEAPAEAPALALVRRVELPPRRSSARRARAFAAETCERWSLPSSVRNAAIDIASELVANAAAYGGGPVVLALEQGAGNLQVRAWDDGPGVPRVLPYRPGVSERGLGLRLVKQLSTHWGVAVDDRGKWVWARIALRGDDGE